MDTWVWIVIALVAVVVVAGAIVWWLMSQQRRSRQLRNGFGPEYDRAVEQYGDRRRAEEALMERKKRVASLRILPLLPAERERYTDRWRDVQARFVDDPRAAIAEADRLVVQVMDARGYPMADFEQRAADISVDHPQVVTNYRSAHAISLATERGSATTEEMRRAMVHHRALFDELLETAPTGARR